VGCTPQSREEYTKAGDETAKAIKTDANAASHAAKSAGAAARTSLNKDGVTHPASSGSTKG
jgi:hypothetical protein